MTAAGRQPSTGAGNMGDIDPCAGHAVVVAVEFRVAGSKSFIARTMKLSAVRLVETIRGDAVEARLSHFL